MVWKITRNIFSKEAALIASFLFAISFIITLHSRWSWNPNLVPFFFLLYLYLFYKLTSLKNNLSKYFYLWILSLAILTQLHASTFILIPVSIILFLLYRPKKLKWQNYLLSLLIVIIAYTPFLIYELTNNFENLIKIITVFFENSEKINLFYKIKFNILGFIEFLNAVLFANFSGLNGNFSFFDNNNVYRLSFIPGFAAFLSIIFISILYIYKNKKKSNILFVIFLLLIVFFTLSKKILFIHYYIIFFPLIFILVGYLLSLLYKKTIITKLLVLLIIFAITLSNFLYFYKYFTGLNNNTWQKHHAIPYSQINKAINYITKANKDNSIYLVCEVQDYCKSFEYLLKLNEIKIDKNSSNKYRIYNSFDIESDFKPIQIEIIK